MAAPLSSGIGTGGAQVYTGTLAYDALKDLLQQQRQDKEKLEAKREKAALKNEKNEKERQTYIRGELGKVYNTDSKIFFSRDGETLIPEITESASEFLNQPGVAEKLYKGDIDTVMEWNKIKTGASAKIQKSVEDKVKSQEIMPEYNRWKSDPDNYDGEYYPEDFENFEKEINTPGSNISGIGKKINIDDFKKKKGGEAWSLWSQIQTEAEKGRTTGKDITEDEAVEITNSIYNDPSFIKGLRHRIRKENPEFSEDQMEEAILNDRESYLNFVKKWTTKETTWVPPDKVSLTDIDKANQRKNIEEWKGEYLTEFNPEAFESVGDSEDAHVRQGLTVPVYDENKKATGQRQSVISAYPEFKKYNIQKLTPHFNEIKKALIATPYYSPNDMLFPVKSPDGTINIGVVKSNGTVSVVSLEDEKEIIRQSPYVLKRQGDDAPRVDAFGNPINQQ
jgi:hypothetical protein